MSTDERIADIADSLDVLLDEATTSSVVSVVTACTKLSGDANVVAHGARLTPRQQKVLDDLKSELLLLAMSTLDRAPYFDRTPR